MTIKYCLYNHNTCCSDENYIVMLTLCRSYLNPYCLGRKTAFFFSGYLNLHAKPETGIPYREKNYNN
jgi:hypothetical protein